MNKLWYVLYGAVIIGVLILETVFFSRVRLFGAQPDIILIMTVVLTFFLPVEKSMICAVIGGLIEDFYIGRMIGSNTFALLVIVLLIYRFAGRIRNENIIFPLAVVFIASLLNGLMMIVFMAFAGNGAFINGELLQDILVGGIYNVILSLLIYPIFYLIFHRFSKESS